MDDPPSPRVQEEWAFLNLNSPNLTSEKIKYIRTNAGIDYQSALTDPDNNLHDDRATEDPDLFDNILQRLYNAQQPFIEAARAYRDSLHQGSAEWREADQYLNNILPRYPRPVGMAIQAQLEQEFQPVQRVQQAQQAQPNPPDPPNPPDHHGGRRRMRRSSKKRATKRKSKRRQRRKSRRLY